MQDPKSSAQTETPTELPKVDVKVDTGSLAKPLDQSGEQWQQIKDQAVSILSELPDYLSGFFNEYQRPIVTVALIVTFIISLKVMLAVIDALNDIPLLSPTFELIGIGYAAWFVYRYLLRASHRQELWKEVKSFTEQITGGKK